MGPRLSGYDGKISLTGITPQLSNPKPTTLLLEVFQLMFSKEEKSVNTSDN
jgi:hypothetical protein